MDEQRKSGDDFESLRLPGFRLILAKQDLPLARRHDWITPDGFEAFCSGGRVTDGGRGPHRHIDGVYAGGSLRIRPARHGGLLGRLLGDRYSGPGRILREFRLWKRLEALDVPLPKAVFAASRRKSLFWVSCFATLERPEAVDGLRFLESRPSEATLFHAGEALADAIGRLHAAGVLHGDLNLRNTLVEGITPGAETRVCLIDLDRAVVRKKASPSERMAEWMRLARSFEKCGAEDLLTPRLRARILRAYCAGNRRLRRQMLDCVPRELRRTTRHRFAWRLLRLTSRRT